MVARNTFLHLNIPELPKPQAFRTNPANFQKNCTKHTGSLFRMILKKSSDKICLHIPIIIGTVSVPPYNTTDPETS